MSGVVLIQATALQIPLKDTSVHCVVTSPPYWGLRNYRTGVWHGGEADCDHSRRSPTSESAITTTSRPTNTNHEREGWRGGVCGKCGAQCVDAQLGLELQHDCLAWARGEPPCGQCYVCAMRQALAEARRVLRDDGTLWLVLGDSYTSGGRMGHGTRLGYKQQSNRGMNGTNDPPRLPQPPGLKPKNLCGTPWRVALALQSDGWVLRSDIVWAKPNCLPSSVTDRPTMAHEYLFLFATSSQYFYDQQAIAEPVTVGSNGRSFVSASDEATKPGLGRGPRGDGCTRNARTVWNIPTQPTSYAHYATMSPALVERCILAGTSAHGCCVQCGSPWVRRIERQRMLDGHTHTTEQGWFPSCGCDAPVRPCTVFDPFVGSGTVPLIARALGRHGVGMDLSYTYLHDQARSRLQLDMLAAWEGKKEHRKAEEYAGLPLFEGHQ